MGQVYIFIFGMIVITIIAMILFAYLCLLKYIFSKSVTWEFIVSSVISMEIVCLIFPGLYEIEGLLLGATIAITVLAFIIVRLIAIGLSSVLNKKIKGRILIGLFLAFMLWGPTAAANISVEKDQIEEADLSEFVLDHKRETLQEMESSIPVSTGLGIFTGVTFIIANSLTDRRN